MNTCVELSHRKRCTLEILDGYYTPLGVTKRKCQERQDNDYGGTALSKRADDEDFLIVSIRKLTCLSQQFRLKDVFSCYFSCSSSFGCCIAQL